MTYILDNLMKFVTLNMNATYAKDGEKEFTAKTFGESIRKCKPQNLDKDDLKKMAAEINQDAEGKQGSIARQIVQTDEPAKYTEFFAHFKVLFKLVQIGLSMKRVNQIKKKQEQIGKEVTDL